MSATVPSHGGDGSQTLERGLMLLEQLGRHPDGATTAQLCAECGLHRSIAHRLLTSLQRSGFATRDHEGRYRVGPAADALARRHGPDLRDVAYPVLRELASTVDATAALVEVIDDYAVTTLVAEPPTQGPRFSYRLGNRDPLDHGAGGLAALASGPVVPGEPERVSQARAKGLIATHGELNPGAYGVAAPLTGWTARAAVYVVTNRPEVAAHAATVIVQAARQIEALARRTSELRHQLAG